MTASQPALVADGPVMVLQQMRQRLGGIAQRGAGGFDLGDSHGHFSGQSAVTNRSQAMGEGRHG